MECFGEDTEFSTECIELVIETMAEGVVFIDVNHVIKFCNKSAVELSGFTKEELIGKDCNDFLICNTTIDCTLFKEGQVTNKECLLETKDGKTIPVVKNGRVVKIGNRVVGAVETFLDISDYKAQQNKIEALTEELNKKIGIPRIIAKSHIMEVVFEQIRLAANSNANTFVSGESGTGKELTARAIHDLSERKDKPFVAVNCSALPETLLESELFGHIKGAFTGAIKDKKGRIEIAEGGTLFLDEIGDISPLIQVKLLRFLQEKEYERVGDSITHKADVRIITATNKNLKELVHQGLFREDLYYRLNVFPIQLPPLRERKEDISILVDFFIKKFRKITKKEIKNISSDALLILMDYNWPGNVRELENAIEHAFVTCQTDTIDIFNLPLEVRKNEFSLPLRSSFENPKVRKRGPISKEKLETILEQTNYNKSEVARILGVDRSTLWRWLKKYDLG